MAEFNVVDFDREKHGPYLFDSFKNSMELVFPWSAVSTKKLLADLKRILASPGCVAKVATIDSKYLCADLCPPSEGEAVWRINADHTKVVVPDDAYLGVAVCRPVENEVVWAYTTYAYRQKFGVMTTLMRECGVTRRRPVGVRYWTRASERIHIDHGWEIYHKVTG